MQRIDPDRFGDVLELRGAQIGDSEIEPRLDLPIGLLREADRAGGRDALKGARRYSRRRPSIAVALLDHVAEMNADAKLDAALRRQASIALDHAGLHLNPAAHRIDYAAELDDDAVPGALDDAGGARWSGQ